MVSRQITAAEDVAAVVAQAAAAVAGVVAVTAWVAAAMGGVVVSAVGEVREAEVAAARGARGRATAKVTALAAKGQSYKIVLLGTFAMICR